MADIAMGSPLVKPKLGMVGASMNAMALIAPGAFLWITYQLQAAATAPSGASVAADIWSGIVVALVLAFLTAISYRSLPSCIPRRAFPAQCILRKRLFSKGRAPREARRTPWRAWQSSARAGRHTFSTGSTRVSWSLSWRP